MAYQGFWTTPRSLAWQQPFPNRPKPLITRGFALGLVGACGAGLVALGHTIPAIAHATPTVVAQVPLGTTTLYVNPFLGQDAPGAGSNDAAPYRTITYALQQAQPGTVVQLARGTYTQTTGEVFPLSIPSGVTLRGEESEKGQTVSIIGGGIYISPTFARQNTAILVDRKTKDIEIRGISVTNPNVRGSGIWVESSDPLITNSTFSKSHREGVFITGTANPKVENSLFIENGGNGIAVANNGRGEIRSNLFQKTGFGVATSENAAPLLESNRFVENVSGLYANDTSRPILRGNIIENNRDDGLVATIKAKPDLGTTETPGNNIIQNNGKYNINNATGETIYSIGNTVDQTRIAGSVEFVAPPIAGTPGGTSAFVDVQGHWAQAYIEALAQQGIISGFPGGTFRPSDPVTRVQFAAIINKAFAPAAKRAGREFSDLNSSFWGYQAIQTAVRGGFMSGYPEGTFLPNQQIPRVQVLVALASGLEFPPGGPTALAKYQDATTIPAYAVSAVAAATERQIVVNYPMVTQLNPTRPATRAEVAAFVYQALVNAGRAQAITSPYVVSLP